jgi:hypothetical protein
VHLPAEQRAEPLGEGGRTKLTAVSKFYTAQLGIEPGDEFEIKLGRKQIRLAPID